MLGQDLRLLLLQALPDARVALQQAQQSAHRVPRRLVACQRSRGTRQFCLGLTGLCKRSKIIANGIARLHTVLA